MGYTRQIFLAGDILTATALNAMDDLIYTNAESLDNFLNTNYVTKEELTTALSNKLDSGEYALIADLDNYVDSAELSNYVLSTTYLEKITALETQLTALEERIAALESTTE